MLLLAVNSSKAMLLVGHVLVVGVVDLNKTWLLTIHKPLVLPHMYLIHSTIKGRWQQLLGKQVQLHLLVHITVAELIARHKSGK
jgi:hypothetical protein